MLINATKTPNKQYSWNYSSEIQSWLITRNTFQHLKHVNRDELVGFSLVNYSRILSSGMKVQSLDSFLAIRTWMSSRCFMMRKP